MWSKGKLFGNNSVPVGIGLLNGEGGCAGNISIKEWGSNSIEWYGLSGQSHEKGHKANLKVIHKHLNLQVRLANTFDALTRMIWRSILFPLQSLTDGNCSKYIPFYTAHLFAMFEPRHFHNEIL